jgi:acetyl esterase/lipase
MGMTYMYHADALTYSSPNYQKIRTPMLIIAGTQDSIIQSSDAFVDKARNAGAPITYFRIDDMDHYVRKRPDIIKKSFEWLSDIMNKGIL